MQRSGYSNLHGEAKAVAELTELLVRQDVLKRQAKIIPGYTPPTKEMNAEIGGRFAALSERAKTAVMDLRGCGHRGKQWQAWLKSHAEAHPADSADLLLLQEHFGGSWLNDGEGMELSLFVRENYGPFDRPWRMAHKW